MIRCFAGSPASWNQGAFPASISCKHLLQAFPASTFCGSVTQLSCGEVAFLRAAVRCAGYANETTA
jgi:hypothetical protein